MVKTVLNYRKPASWITIVVVIIIVGVTIGLHVKSKQLFTIEKTEKVAMNFSTYEPDLLKFGEAAYDHYYSSFQGEKIPKECQMTSYKLTDISLLARNGKEFCVWITASYSATGLYFLNANGNFKTKGYQRQL